jgi:hypothetical protein
MPAGIPGVVTDLQYCTGGGRALLMDVFVPCDIALPATRSAVHSVGQDIVIASNKNPGTPRPYLS